MKIAVVTGASSGMGKEFALQIASRYSKMNEIWIIARRKELLEELESEIKIPVRIFAMDLTNRGDLLEFNNYLEAVKPEIKLLVNSAGYGKIGSFLELDIDEQCGMIDLNCKGLTMFTGICMPYITDKSRIINLASSAGFSPQPNFNVYAATKAYVLSYSRALHEELKSRKITVTAVCPGPVDTEFFDIAGDVDKRSFKKILRAKPEKVVDKAIKDAAFGSPISVYGISMKFARIATKILPHNMIVKIFR